MRIHEFYELKVGDVIRNTRGLVKEIVMIKGTPGAVGPDRFCVYVMHPLPPDNLADLWRRADGDEL